MASFVRVELLENEKKRRDEVIAAAEKHRKGAAEKLTQLHNSGKIATFCAKLALSRVSLAPYPLVSADYQHWLEDEQAWISVFKTRDGFHWPPPPPFGAPYSRAYLEAFYEETEEEKKKRIQEQERYAATFPTTTTGEGEEPSHAEVIDDSEDDEANWDDNVETPTAWDNNGTMTLVEHSHIDDIFAVWTTLFGSNVWPKGCQPFEVPIPKHMDPKAVLAAPEDLPALMFQLWQRFSPAEPWCIRFFTRYRKDPSARFGIRMWLFIDWPAKQDHHNESWLRLVYYATICLFSWYHKLLQGEQIHIMDDIKSRKKWELQQHHNMFNNIQIRTALNAQQKQAANAIEGDKAVTRGLYHKQQVTIKSLAFSIVERHVKSTADPDKQLELLVQVVEKGVRPLPLALDDRRLAVAGAAKTILAGAVLAALQKADGTIETRMSDVSKFLVVGTEDAWEKVLPLGTRFDVVCDMLRQHATDPEDQPFLVDWITRRSFMNDSNEYSSNVVSDEMTQGVRGLSL
ncbi:hypothetical protein GGS24DRAFT_507079 [Hypoxylon argillaceum]|nr:hypothetical protein GGS24DRAFT_507079 [Hypoxylon argillaceum]